MQISISQKTHEFLKRECAELDTPSMTDFVEFLVEIYKENRAIFNELSGGVIGIAKLNLFNQKVGEQSHD